MESTEAPSTTVAENLHDTAIEARQDLKYVRDQLALCLEVLDEGPHDLESLQERYRSLAEKLRKTADRLDSQDS